MSKESKFKLIGRIAVYNNGQRSVGSIVSISSTGGPIGFLPEDGGPSYCVHPKQCRLLKPKRPRRRIWVNEYDGGLDAFQHPLESCADRASGPARSACIEFIEVRRKK